MTANHPIRRNRLFLLGDARQVHMRRWAEWFAAAGYQVLSYSLESTRGFTGDIRSDGAPAFLPKALRYPLSVPAVKRLMEAFAPHVVNAHFAPNYGLIAALAGRTPWILSTWGSDILTDPRKSPLHRMRTRFVLSRAQYVTSDAEVMTREIIDMGVPPGRVLTFPFGVDTSVFYPAKTALPEPLGVVSTRKLERLYDVATVVRAFGLANPQIPGARLTIAGDGAERASLERLVSTVPGPIEVCGNVAHGRVADLLRGHHIFVSTAHSDTTSVSLLEAMACGLFPIVTDIPANREWISDGENGLLFPPGDARSLASALAAAGRDAAARARAAERNAEIVEERALWRDNMSLVQSLFDRLAGASG